MRDDTYPAVVDIVLLVCGVVAHGCRNRPYGGRNAPNGRAGTRLSRGRGFGSSICQLLGDMHTETKKIIIPIIQLKERILRVRLRSANGKAAYIRSLSRADSPVVAALINFPALAAAEKWNFQCWLAVVGPRQSVLLIKLARAVFPCRPVAQRTSRSFLPEHDSASGLGRSGNRAFHAVQGSLDPGGFGLLGGYGGALDCTVHIGGPIHRPAEPPFAFLELVPSFI